MANTFLTPSIIAREALMLLESNMVFGNLVFRGHQTEFTGSKVGDTITVRGPANFTADEYDGATLTIQDASESAVPLVLEKHFDVSFKVSDREMTLSIADFGVQLLNPAMLAIAEAVDAYVAGKMNEAWSWIGTAGDPPDSLVDIAAIDKEQNFRKAPGRGRVQVVDPTAKADLFSIASFAEADKRGDDGTALREASMGRYMGYDYFMNQNIQSHTVGSLTGTIVVTGVNAIGAKSIGLTTGAGEAIALKKGDLVAIAGQTGRGGTNDFVVTADLTVGASSAGNMLIEPGLDVATAGAEAVTLAVGTSHVGNLAFHPFGIVLAAVPLVMPQGAARADMVQNRGLGIRIVYDYDRNAKSDVVSLDILVGAKVQDPKLVTRVLG